MRNEIHSLLRETMRHSGIPSEEVPPTLIPFLLLYSLYPTFLLRYLIAGEGDCSKLFKHRFVIHFVS